MKFIKKNGETGVIVRVFIQDTSKTTGEGVTGLTSSSAIQISVISDVESAPTAYFGSNIESITTLGTYAAPTSGKVRFKELTSANLPGIYEIQLADARWAVSGAKTLLGMVFGPSVNAAQTPFEAQLDAGDVIADQLLARNVSGGSSSGRTVKQALHFIRNKWAIVSGVLTVYDTDDTTTSWSSAVSSDAAANPAVGNDPS